MDVNEVLKFLKIQFLFLFFFGGGVVRGIGLGGGGQGGCERRIEVFWEN